VIDSAALLFPVPASLGGACRGIRHKDGSRSAGLMRRFPDSSSDHGCDPPAVPGETERRRHLIHSSDAQAPPGAYVRGRGRETDGQDADNRHRERPVQEPGHAGMGSSTADVRYRAAPSTQRRPEAELRSEEPGRGAAACPVRGTTRGGSGLLAGLRRLRRPALDSLPAPVGRFVDEERLRHCASAS
jgi:hypothetical protein